MATVDAGLVGFRGFEAATTIAHTTPRAVLRVLTHQLAKGCEVEKLGNFFAVDINDNNGQTGGLCKILGRFY